MTYSIDLRERVVDFVRSGGSKAEAARRFGVHRDTVYDWLSRGDIAPAAHGQRHRKIDKERLRAHVKQYPDMVLRERCKIFNVTIQALSHALKTMNIRKKNSDGMWSETL